MRFEAFSIIAKLSDSFLVCKITPVLCFPFLMWVIAIFSQASLIIPSNFEDSTLGFLVFFPRPPHSLLPLYHFPYILYREFDVPFPSLWRKEFNHLFAYFFLFRYELKIIFSLSNILSMWTHFILCFHYNSTQNINTLHIYSVTYGLFRSTLPVKHLNFFYLSC